MIKTRSFKGKKGFLFTFITVFLLFASVVLSYNYMQRNKQSQEFLASINHADRLNFIKENVVSDYFSMLDISLDEIKRNETNVILKFNNFSTFREQSSYPANLKKQELFTEGHFSNLSNINIQIENFIPEFSFYPYNTTFVIDNLDKSNEFFIYVNDFNRFNGIKVDIYLNTSISDLNLTKIPVSDASNNPYLDLRIFDIDKNILLDTFAHFNSLEENGNYEIAFNKIVKQFILPTYSIDILQNISINYGLFRDTNLFGDDTLTNATFHLVATGLDARIGNMSLNYSATPKKAVLMTRAQMYLE